jgi:serine beta-lactamase-like protein LACTB
VIKRRYSITLVVVVVALWQIGPFYGYLSHKGKVPMLPFSFVTIPAQNPATQLLLDERYKTTGDQAITQLTKHKKTINAPAISAAVAIDCKLVWAGASGWSDIAKQQKVTPNTQFRIGSTTKALTSVGLARLVDEGVIALDVPIEQYHSTLPNPQWNKLTVRQLASHTAGLPHYGENSDFFGKLSTATLSNHYEDVFDSLAVFDTSELLSTPGTKFHYSSNGTVLLSAIMQSAANTSYQNIMSERVFKPAKVYATGPEGDANTNDMATFYWNDNGKRTDATPWRDVDLSHRLAAGGFVSTPSDLVKIGSMFLNQEFVSTATSQMFWTPQIVADGTPNPDGYSIGWRVMELDVGGDIGKIKFANHGGVSRGAQSWLMVIPKYQMTIAVNINSKTEYFWTFGKVSLVLARQFIEAKLKLK